jgi:hypothetical protein
VMGKALDGLDEKEVRSLHDGLNAIKANLKTELHSGACRKMSHSK